MKSITLKLGGKPFDPQPPSPVLLKIMAFLDRSPQDELFTVSQVASKIGSGANYVHDLGRDPLLGNYSHKAGKIRYFGNPKAIAELRRQVGA